MEFGEKMGLQVKALQSFVVEQQSMNNNRRRDGELRRLELENEEVTHKRNEKERDGAAAISRNSG